MVLSPAVLRGGAIALTALWTWAQVVHAAPAPDSAGVARVQAACDAAPRLRITTERAVYEPRRVRVDPGGLLLPGAQRPALVTVGDVHDPGRRIPWAEVVRIDSERSRAARVALLGGVFAAVPVTITLATHGTDAFEEGDQVLLIFGIAFVVAAIGVGGLLGSLQPDLHRIYP